MIKHIFIRIWNERRSNFWIALELLIISVCLWFVVDYLYVKLYTYTQPLGFDITNTYHVKYNRYKPTSYLYKEESEEEKKNSLRLFLETIKRDTDVEAICLTNNLFHYVQEMSTNYISSTKNDSLATDYARFYKVTPDYFNVFRVKDKSGSSWQSLAVVLSEGGTIITSTTESFLFEDDFAIGKKFYVGSSESVVKGVAQLQRPSEFNLPLLAVYNLLLEQDNRAYIFVRIKPMADGDLFADQFAQRMREHLVFGNIYLDELVPMQSYRKSFIKESMDQLQIGSAIAFFFLVNIFLGVLGTFWFRTRQRKSELGLRVALGSNRMQLLTLFIGEGIVLLTITFVPAIILCFNICYAELIDVYLMPFDGLRFATGLGITYSLLAIMIVLGIWIPAQQAIKVSPTEALHNT